jgi:hypothetical protein
MKGLSGVVLLICLLIAIIFVSGCICGPVNDILPYPLPFIPTSTPAPVPTLKPTSTPIPPSPQPMVITPQSSYDVRIHPAFITFEFKKYDLEQTENITVVVMNDGTTTAKNAKLILTLMDAQRNYNLITQQYEVGDLSRGDRKIFSMETARHEAANSVYVQVRIVWGEYGEYSNPDTFVNRAWSVWM